MAFRVTPHRTNEIGQYNATNRYAQSAVLNNQISTGNRVSKPSDDPVAQRTILAQNSVISRLDTQLSTVSTNTSKLNESNSQLLAAQQLLVQAKQIASDARQSTEPTDRAVYVSQLNSILTRLDDIANSQFGGEYLFSGTQSGTAPFTGVQSGTATYQGGTSNSTVSIGSYGPIDVLYSGKDVFQPSSGGQLIVSGDTGVTSGTGISSANVTTTLTLTHTQTIYAGTSGIQTGTDSVSGDTILGSAGKNTLTIHDTSGNGTAGTISLNGGDAVAFTNSDGNLKVTDPFGQVVYVNTQAISPGFSGTVDITANGTMSIDGGVTQVPIDFTGNQVVADPARGAIQYFDTTNVSKVGSVQAAPAKTTDIFQAVASLRDTILNTSNLTNDERDAAFVRQMTDLDNASTHLLNVIGEQSVTLQSLSDMKSRMSDSKLNAQTLLSNAQSTDYATVISQLQEQQYLLQFTLQSLTTLNNTSILDFLN